MKKVDSLRALLLAAVPSLAADPAKLSLFADKGKVRAVRGASLAYETAFTATIWIEAFAGDLDMLFVPILSWISAHQPDLLGRPDAEPFTFESELLDADSSDIWIEIALTERVLVERRPNGTLRTRHLTDEPRIDLATGFEQGGATGWSVLLDDMTAGA